MLVRFVLEYLPLILQILLHCKMFNESTSQNFFDVLSIVNVFLSNICSLQTSTNDDIATNFQLNEILTLKLFETNHSIFLKKMTKQSERKKCIAGTIPNCPNLTFVQDSPLQKCHYTNLAFK